VAGGDELTRHFPDDERAEQSFAQEQQARNQFGADRIGDEIGQGTWHGHCDWYRLRGDVEV